MSDEDAIPPAARLVRDFVNSCQLDIAWEAWATPEQLRDWFAARGLLEPDAVLSASDTKTAVTIREGLRATLLDEDAAPLDDALARVPLRLSFAGGSPRLVAADEGALDRALAGVLDAIRQCAEEQIWTRLKVCDKDSCRWAFYDASRNRVRRWCSMADCGNKVKMRRAYERRSGSAPISGPP